MNCERDIRFELLARLCPNSTGELLCGFSRMFVFLLDSIDLLEDFAIDDQVLT
jgi:hypothetical protein